jgi:hypothetical protein
MLSYIRHAEGRAEIEDIQLLNNHDVCRQDYFTDLKAAEVLRAILAGTFNENIPGRKDQVNADNDVIQGEIIFFVLWLAEPVGGSEKNISPFQRREQCRHSKRWETAGKTETAKRR